MHLSSSSSTECLLPSGRSHYSPDANICRLRYSMQEPLTSPRSRRTSPTWPRGVARVKPNAATPTGNKNAMSLAVHYTQTSRDGEYAQGPVTANARENVRVVAQGERRGCNRGRDSDRGGSSEQVHDDKARRNFADPEPHTMPTSGSRHFIQANSAQEAVDSANQVRVAVTNAPPDNRREEPVSSRGGASQHRPDAIADARRCRVVLQNSDSVPIHGMDQSPTNPLTTVEISSRCCAFRSDRVLAFSAIYTVITACPLLA